MTEIEFKVSLRIQGDELIPDRVTQLVDCVPTQSHAKGDNIETRNFVRSAPTGVWILQEDKAHLLDKAINDLFNRIEENQETWKAITSKFRAEILIGVFLSGIQNGFTLSEKTVRRVASLGIALSFDMYST